MDKRAARYIKRLKYEMSLLKEKNESQLSMYEMTTLYMKQLQDDLKASEQQLIKTNKSLTESINYARRIQNAFTVSAQVLEEVFPESFIFYQPKDILSGDFVWMFTKDNKVYCAVGDCTGHGVPGAMLTIFVISMLNQVLNHSKNDTPADILKLLYELIQKYIGQYTSEVKDSADIALVRLDKESNELLFASANRPLYLIRENELQVYNGEKYHSSRETIALHEFTNQELKLQAKDMVYLFSDGLSDQFGGEKNKKFMSYRLKELLVRISNQSSHEQYTSISQTFSDWKGLHTQTDDVLLVGFRCTSPDGGKSS